ncbi:hypothetical protein cypCar_00005189, partial [Cyprinus carpio]
LFSHSLREGLVQTQHQLLSLDDQDIIMRPLKGEIWPNSTAEVNIIFKPQEARIYQQTVYCEITGTYSSIMITDVLLLSNKGLINGAYKLVKPSPVLGLCFSFNPSEGMIPPEGVTLQCGGKH